MRSPDWNAGRRNGIKWAVAWLHRRAMEMNDPSAKAALDTAASHMGQVDKIRLRDGEYRKQFGSEPQR